MFKGITSVTLLIIANCFMTLAWYGHLDHLVGFALIVLAVFFVFRKW